MRTFGRFLSGWRKNRAGRPFGLRRCLNCGMALATLATTAAWSQQRTVWQIGTFDDSSREFHDTYGVDYANKSSDMNYVVGKSTERDWLRFQPGPANGMAGGRLHPFRIRFSLPDAPSGVYILKLAVLYETPRLSALRVEVNGHWGKFTFAPRLDYAAGDWEGTFVPQTSRAERSIAVPAKWMHQGDNIITLTAVDEPATAQNSLGDIAPGESGIVYDALALEQDGSQQYAEGEIVPTAQATIFFREGEGGLREVVRACVDAHAGRHLPTEILWTSKGFRDTKKLHFGQAEFGESCTEFNVPEWTGTLDGRLSVGGTTRPVALTAQKKWTMLIVPHEHLDIGFTDYREKVAELQSQSIDGVLDLLPQHPEFRWTMDGSWVAQQYLAGRSPERIEQFLSAVRAGKIVIPQQFANQHTGVASLEGLTRSLYPSATLARKFNVPIGAANITDVPSYSWSYASILHDAGVKYFAAASNSWRAPIILEGRWNEKSPFYWEGPDGGRVLMWYSRAYLQLASLLGTPPTVEAAHDALPVFLEAYEREDYHASSVILFGSQLENTPLDREQVKLPSDWAKEYEYPRLEFSTFKDAMSEIEREFAGTIPTYRGDFGPYWEDGFTSDARATALHRANQQRTLNAETMGTIPSLLDPSLRPNEALMADAWNNSLLFDEHTWTSVAATTQPEGDQSIRQTASKRAQVVRASEDLTYSIERSFAQLESTLRPKESSLLVFNALNWTRSGWLETDLAEGTMIVDPETRKPLSQVTLRTETGTPLPGFGGRSLRVRYFATDVPAVGYKMFPIVAAGTLEQAMPATETGVQTLENQFYRVTLSVASGSIRSIWDKELKRELVDTGGPFRFASYVYVTGADDMPNNSLYRYGATLPQPVLTPHEATGGRLVGVTHSAAGESATMESRAPNTPHIETVVTLPSDGKRIDISVSLDKDATLHREAAYIAFPLAMEKAEFAYDTQNGWVDPARNELAGGSREWYVVQHWAALHNRTWAAAVIPVDAPLVTFGDVVRGKWPETFAPEHASIFSWLMSNYWSTNFIASQGGHYTFRYAFVSGPRFAPEELTRAGWEQMTPLESDPVPANLMPSGDVKRSFLAIDNPDVVMSTWKRAEDGHGSIVRLTEIAGRTQTVHLSTPHLQLEQVQACSLLEDCKQLLPVRNGSVSFEMKPFAIVTLRLMTDPEGKP